MLFRYYNTTTTTTTTTKNTFFSGPKCYFFCDCHDDQFCDPVEGCINITTTIHSIREETTRQGPNNPAKNISSSPQSTIGN